MENLTLFGLNVHKEQQEQQQQRRSMDLRGEARGQKFISFQHPTVLETMDPCLNHFSIAKFPS